MADERKIQMKSIPWLGVVFLSKRFHLHFNEQPPDVVCLFESHAYCTQMIFEHHQA
jgi:hypothetical protein